MMLGASGLPMHMNTVTPVTSHEVVSLQGSGKVRWLQKGWAQCRLECRLIGSRLSRLGAGDGRVHMAGLLGR
jgi:hypothetical protein